MAAPLPHYGELMALLAAMIFAWTSVLFTKAGQRLGVTTVNLLRLPGGALCLLLSHLALTGRPWPADLAPLDQFWIGLSGVVGLAIGDSALFEAFTRVGPRRSMTMMALAPVFTVVIAWSALGEHLGPWAILGIVVVIAGVMVAQRGRSRGGREFADLPPRVLRLGLLLALVAAAGQGLGSVFAKLGMTGSGGSAGADPLGATLVRMAWAAILYWAFQLLRGRTRGLAGRLRDRRGLLYLGGAILMGPFISVWISLVAIRNTEAGVAQVLLGMVPIFVVVPAWLIYRDRPRPLTLLGIALAVGGGALLILR